jgi:release factor glutamine methyltransferase
MPALGLPAPQAEIRNPRFSAPGLPSGANFDTCPFMPDRPAQWTVLALLNWTKDHLQRAGVASPRLAAEVLLASAMGCRRIELYTRYDHAPPEETLARFRESVRRAAKREPVAYLVGEKEFYSLPFKVTPDVLVPRPETELLVEEAVERLRSLGRPGSMWDVCTGSGCVALAAARQVADASVLATDLSPAAVEIARQNASRLGMDDRVRIFQADMLHLPPEWTGSASFDVITANPPYIPDAAEVAPEVMHEPAMALRGGPDGLRFLRGIIEGAPAMLAPGGLLVLEFGFDQCEAVRQLIDAAGPYAEPRILRDRQGIERAAAVRKS